MLTLKNILNCFIQPLYFSKPDAPATPDYVGAAAATASGNLDAARVAAKANRVSQYTPYGNLVYTNDPNDQDKWSSTVSLSPTGQKLLDYQNNASIGLGEQTQNALNRVNDTLSKPFDYGSVQDVQDAAYKTYTSRLDPQWQQQRQQLDSQLANQGITLGSEAYDNAMRNFNQGKNDAYQQATTAAINLSPQTLQLAQALRSQPLNELNALRTGSQVTNPTFQSTPQQATTAGADILGATQAGYNSQLGAYNAQQAAGGNTMGGLFSLGSGALQSPWLGKAFGL